MKLITHLKRMNLLFLIKVSIGSAIAILIADRLGLLYSPSAGIITLLTIQNTKKETIFIALKRIGAFLLAVVISYACFQSLGFTPLAYGCFVFLFVALCILFGFKDGISMNAVLMTHFLIEKRIDLPLLWNEIILLCIGMGIGIILNLIMPNNKKKIRNEQKLIEEEIKLTLQGLSNMLWDKEACLVQTEGPPSALMEREINEKHTVNFQKLENKLELLLKTAYEEADNTLLSDTKYLVSYLEMRKLQIGVLKDIKQNIETIPVILKQTFPIAEFLEHISKSFHERNNVKKLLEELNELKECFRKEPLPQSREEFEYRAILFQILKELEYFLILKRDFVQRLEENNIVSYWSE